MRDLTRYWLRSCVRSNWRRPMVSQRLWPLVQGVTIRPYGNYWPTILMQNRRTLPPWIDPDFCPLFTIKANIPASANDLLVKPSGGMTKFNMGNDYPAHFLLVAGGFNPYHAVKIDDWQPRRIFVIVRSWSESVDPKFPLRRLCALQFGLRTIFGRVMFPIGHPLQNQGQVLIVGREWFYVGV